MDFTILLPPGGKEAALREIAAAFPPRVEDAVAFALKHRVLPIEVPGGSEADLSLELPGYEEHVIARSVAYDLGDGREVRLCSAEDLVIHKALAGRPQDVLDIEDRGAPGRGARRRLRAPVAAGARADRRRPGGGRPLRAHLVRSRSKRSGALSHAPAGARATSAPGGRSPASA